MEGQVLNDKGDEQRREEIAPVAPAAALRLPAAGAAAVAPDLRTLQESLRLLMTSSSSSCSSFLPGVLAAAAGVQESCWQLWHLLQCCTVLLLGPACCRPEWHAGFRC